MSISVFINFQGNCREAVTFYAKVFGCEMPKLMTYGDLPPSENYQPIPEEQKAWVMYTDLKIADGVIMFSDVPKEMGLKPGNNVNITIGTSNKEDITKWFDGLKDGAQVHMELQQTFWSECYGMLVDKFGISWQFSLDSGWKM